MNNEAWKTIVRALKDLHFTDVDESARLILERLSGAGFNFDPIPDDEEIVEKGIELARRFYQSHGYEVGEGFKFFNSKHPTEIGMWNLAVIAFDELLKTDLEDALSNTELEE